MFDYIKELFGEQKISTVAVNFRPVSGPWGGASVFLQQLELTLKRCGIKVIYKLKGKIDVIFIIDPRENLQRTAFGLNDIEQYKNAHPEVLIIHRINECDQRKNTDFLDEMLKRTNKIADYTVFISSWLQRYFVDKWFDSSKPHCVIYNGADTFHFHPVGSSTYKGIAPFRLVTHHWSDNPMKGFPVYKQVDEMIAGGELEGFELWVIGRWPKDIRWKSARTFPPASGKELADLLRKCHLYITASLWEPCGMHHVEGAQCGLPLVCHSDGGGIVEAAEVYGMIFDDHDLLECLHRARSEYTKMREKVLLHMPSGDRMCSDYVRIIQLLLARKSFAT